MTHRLFRSPSLFPTPTIAAIAWTNCIEPKPISRRSRWEPPFANVSTRPHYGSRNSNWRSCPVFPSLTQSKQKLETHPPDFGTHLPSFWSSNSPPIAVCLLELNIPDVLYCMVGSSTCFCNFYSALIYGRFNRLEFVLHVASVITYIDWVVLAMIQLLLFLMSRLRLAQDCDTALIQRWLIQYLLKLNATLLVVVAHFLRSLKYHK